MGKGSSKLPIISDTSMKTLLSQQLRKEHMTKLYRLFKEEDTDGINGWTVSELFHVIEENRLSVRAPIIDALFFMGDTRGEGTLNWEDFIVTFTSFCTLSRAEVMQFLFILIDRERKGRITKKELMDFFSYVPVGAGEKKPVFPINNKNCLDKFRGGKWTSLTFDGLAQLCEMFPYIAYPAYHTQELYQRVLLGTKFWERLDKERVTFERWESKITVVVPGSGGREVEIRLPPFCTMQEILEFSRRKTQAQQGRRVHSQRNVRPSRLTAERDEQISRCPVMTLIRNARCMYFVPSDMQANEAALRASRTSIKFGASRPEFELRDLDVKKEDLEVTGEDEEAKAGGGVLSKAMHDEEEEEESDESDSESDSEEESEEN